MKVFWGWGSIIRTREAFRCLLLRKKMDDSKKETEKGAKEFEKRLQNAQKKTEKTAAVAKKVSRFLSESNDFLLSLNI